MRRWEQGPIRGAARKAAMQELKDNGMEAHARCLDTRDVCGSLADYVWSDPGYVCDIVGDRIPVNGFGDGADLAGYNACWEYLADKAGHAAEAARGNRIADKL